MESLPMESLILLRSMHVADSSSEDIYASANIPVPRNRCVKINRFTVVYNKKETVHKESLRNKPDKIKLQLFKKNRDIFLAFCVINHFVWFFFKIMVF